MNPAPPPLAAPPARPPGTPVTVERLSSAHAAARAALLAERCEAGHWIGELATSALSTATAVSALALVQRAASGSEGLSTELPPLIVRGIAWLARHQNDDGGWGDTDLSYSNISTTLLAIAAFHLAGVSSEHTDQLARAQRYVHGCGGLPALRKRYGRDKTFAVPILTNLALAGLVDWREVSPLPFELACFPQSMYRMLRLPVVSYAIPALVAIGQARFFHRPPWNPLQRRLRGRLVDRSLRILQRMQPASGGYLEAVPLTSFVVMSLAATGRASHDVTQRGVRFLIESVRPDGSWPIDTNLATWTTSLSLNALIAGGEDISNQPCLDWLLGCQTKQIHPFTGAEPGGWGWTDLTGSVPDADDTPSALLALATWSRSPKCSGPNRRRIRDAAAAGIRWLLGLQNSNGGWPTFCRGWGKLPFDRSGADLTAHVIRSLHAWSDLVDCRREIERGFRYLARCQQPDGSWIPLWFGNQDHVREENPVYGTARVLLAYRDLGRLDAPEAQRGLAWLRRAQNPDGGWSTGTEFSAELRPASSVEETAIAVEALLAEQIGDSGPATGAIGDSENWLEGASPELHAGVAWLIEAVETGRFRKPAPIGFYFAKLWYHEKLYPIIFTTAAFGRAARQWSTQEESTASGSPAANPDRSSKVRENRCDTTEVSPLSGPSPATKPAEPHLLSPRADGQNYSKSAETFRQRAASGIEEGIPRNPIVKQPCP